MTRSTLASLFALFLTACPGPEPEPEPMARDLTLTARGLYDHPNPLSEVPDGALSRADDVVIRRPGIVETRRGFAPTMGVVGASEDRITSLHDFAGTLIGHTSGGTLARYDGSVWTPYAGTYSAPEGRRMRFLQTAKSLYFTTDMGVQRLDEVDGEVVPAGVPQALAGTAATTGTTGFLPPDSATAYRYVWGYRNAHDRVILGAPSSRMTVRNGSLLMPGDPANVQLTVPVPPWVTEDYFLQVYRADTSAAASIVPGDDMGLVYERYPNAGEIEAGVMSLPVDVAPDETKGAYLYSAPNAGAPGSEKFQPPVCTDLTEYKGRTWMGCTTQRQRLVLTLLSADGASGGMNLGDGLQFTRGNEYPDRYLASTVEDTTSYPKQFILHTDGTPAQNISRTIQSLARVINGAVIGQPPVFTPAFYAYDNSGEFDEPGKILLEARDLGSQEILVEAFAAPGTYWAPALGYTYYVDGFDRATANEVHVVGQRVHGFSVGQKIRLTEAVISPPSAAQYYPLGEKTVTAVTGPKSFRYYEPGPQRAGDSGTMTFVPDFDAVPTSPEDAPNSLTYAEFGEPDAVPLGGYLPVGSANYPLLRVMALGDTLMLFKSDGTHILTGDTPEAFNVRDYPNPAKLLAPDSLVKLANSIYALTDQGVMTFTESGARVISGPIEGRIKDLIAGDEAMKNKVRDLAFGVAYETEKEYWLFLPSAATDTACTQAYVFNYLTGTWVHWPQAASSGYVLPGQDKAYLGRHDFNGVLVERKARTATDYQDADGVPIPSAVTWQVRTGEDPGAYKQWVKGSVLLEKQKPDSPETFVLPPDQLTLSVSTEVDPTPISGPFDLDGLPYVMTYIPEEHSRSQLLSFGVSGGQAGRRMGLTGLSVDYVSSSTKLR